MQQTTSCAQHVQVQLVELNLNQHRQLHGDELDPRACQQCGFGWRTTMMGTPLSG
jgi:hypothetical protein